MSSERKPSTSEINGRLWSARAQDWASLNEVSLRPVYEAVLTRLSVRDGTQYLDVGCGSGLAAQIATERGAEVHGIDAAEALLTIARSRSPKGEFRNGDLERYPIRTRSSTRLQGSIHSNMCCSRRCRTA